MEKKNVNVRNKIGTRANEHVTKFVQSECSICIFINANTIIFDYLSKLLKYFYYNCQL